MARIYQRKGKKGLVWYADYSLNGQRVQVSLGKIAKAKAKEQLALLTADVVRGVYALPVKLTFSEMADDYMKYAKVHKRSWLRDEQILVHLSDPFGAKRLTQIDRSSVEDYQCERLLERAAPATVNREVALLKRIFNFADERGKFRGRNPVKGVKFLDENNRQTRVLSEAEEAALLRCCSPTMQYLVTFALNTGMRHGDMLDLEWREVDLEGEPVITMQVGKSEPRRILEVPLNSEAVRVVRAWQGMRVNHLVFYNPETGEQWRDLWLGLKKAHERAGIDKMTWHTLRHTFASRLLGRGVDIVIVKELLGHSSVKVTERYLHPLRKAKFAAVNVLCDKSETNPIAAVA